MTRQEQRNEIAHKIAWENSKHYDPLLCKEAWCEMAARDAIDWADEHPDLYSVTRKAIAREREHMIKKTAEFLWNCGCIDTLVVDEVIDSYKKYMEEQL